MECESIARPRFHFGGLLGQRIDANEANWLLRAPHDNPGLLDMFRVRDQKPEPDLVPWAGEFVGKYLISAIQALRMSDNPQLRTQTNQIVANLIAAQAEDGYMGPFPRAIRLKANWDLWGHYHCMQALLTWHEDTGDTAALASARKIGDLICNTFLHTNLRIRDVGSPEMNMAVIHGLGILYRHTHEPRYLAMMREIETDWETAGDYLRQGVAAIPFYQTPRPRWESLHDLQGLVELYRITGDAKYKLAFENLWRGILRWDRHNTGAFSTGEGASGNPYAPGAIETCCTIAWMAITLDMLRISGDARVADELELSTWNACLGAQHPTGEWWTYDTPMAGTRIPSYKAIAFQARPTTPELNCCSVNGPRGLGMLTEWAVMRDKDGLLVNFYGPGFFKGKLADKTPIELRWETEYPRDGKVLLHISPDRPRRFTLKLRIPAWSDISHVWVNGRKSLAGAVTGTYYALNRAWKPGDVVTLLFDMRLRGVPGAKEAAGHVSLYKGPILLAYDTHDNSASIAQMPPVFYSTSPHRRDVWPEKQGERYNPVPNPILLLSSYDQNKDQTLRLRDFASAGTSGTEYASWLPDGVGLPAPAQAKIPFDGAAVPPGKILFEWTAPKTPASGRTYWLRISESERLGYPVLTRGNLSDNRLVVDAEEAAKWKPGHWYYWAVAAREGKGSTFNNVFTARFRIDASLPPHPENYFAPKPRRDLIIQDNLRGKPAPVIGSVQPTSGYVSAPGPNDEPNGAVDLNGVSDMLRYNIGTFPEEDFSVCIAVHVAKLPTGLGQVFSAWAVSQDDPLRICVEKGKLFARMETGGNGFSTEGVPMPLNTWMRVAVVKEESTLTLYVDGVKRGMSYVPVLVHSYAKDIALGGNPHYSGNEFLAARLSDFRFYGRALSEQEVQQWAEL